MTAIIIEDELLAQAKLEHLLTRVQPGAVVVARLGSVKETLAWLISNEPPDVAFVDIQLSDDHSFEIFRHFEPAFPIVFTTAYDKYVLESFEYNSIDYLLKPITEEKLRRTLDKLKRLSQHFTRQQLIRLKHAGSALHPETGKHLPQNETDADLTAQGALEENHEYMDRVIARKGSHYIMVPVDQVAYFFSMHKIVFLKDLTGKQMIVDKNLATLEATLDPKEFTRLNRKYIAAARSIVQYTPVQGKLLVRLKPDAGEDVFVSKESAPKFKAWIRH